MASICLSRQNFTPTPSLSSTKLPRSIVSTASLITPSPFLVAPIFSTFSPVIRMVVREAVPPTAAEDGDGSVNDDEMDSCMKIPASESVEKLIWSPGALELICRASEIALENGHGFCCPEHLLLALMEPGKIGFISKLIEFRVEIIKFARDRLTELEKEMKNGNTDTIVMVRAKATPCLLKVYEEAHRLSMEDRGVEICSHHLLIALLEHFGLDFHRITIDR